MASFYLYLFLFLGIYSLNAQADEVFIKDPYSVELSYIHGEDKTLLYTPFSSFDSPVLSSDIKFMNATLPYASAKIMMPGNEHCQYEHYPSYGLDIHLSHITPHAFDTTVKMTPYSCQTHQYSVHSVYIQSQSQWSNEAGGYSFVRFYPDSKKTQDYFLLTIYSNNPAFSY